METKQISDLTYADIMTGLPEDFAAKYKEVIIILLSTMINMTKAEADIFITVYSRILAIQSKVLSKEAAEAMMTTERGWN
jgi:formylmethanofuran dehydrogenase subunit B